MSGAQGADPDGHLRPVTAALVGRWLVLGALVGWLVVTLFDLLEQPLPVTPWTMSAMLAALGVGAAVYAHQLRGQVADPARRPSTEQAVGSWVVARTMVVVGLLLAGGHLAYALSQSLHLDIALARRRAVFALVAVAASAVFVLGGWLLERACRVPPDGSPDGQDISDT